MIICLRMHMKTKPVLSLADVKAILSAAEQHANKHNWAVTISVVDDGGHLLGMVRLDGAAPISAHISPAKAHTAALGQRESKGYEDTINQGRTARSEERRVGKEGVSTFRSRWSPYH